MKPNLPRYRFQLTMNTLADRQQAYGDAQACLFDRQSHLEARGVISSWPGYTATPLRDLRGLAKAAGVASIHYKDEGSRFGLGSFKPLGGAYAVSRLLARVIRTVHGVADVTPQEIIAGRYRETLSKITVTAATDGNHGRSVAWGAGMFGCRCVIFIHATVTAGRERAIAAFGAEVRRAPGTYDDAVRIAQQTADLEGWHLIPDTSDGSQVDAPRDVMRGYTVMAAEAMEQLPYAQAPTHLFLQAGVGGMAAAVLAHFWQAYPESRPRSILVEPETAACWFLSLQAGRPQVASGALQSIMAGLACGEISGLAWIVLGPGADAALQIEDAAAADCMRLLAGGDWGDAPIVAGESGVAGLAGMLAVAEDDSARERLALNEHSRILVFGTEGASDPQTYAEIVGRKPEDVCRL